MARVLAKSTDSHEAAVQELVDMGIPPPGAAPSWTRRSPSRPRGSVNMLARVSSADSSSDDARGH